MWIYVYTTYVQKVMKENLCSQVILQFMYLSYSIQLINAAQQKVLIKTCANKFCYAKCYIVKYVISYA